MSMAPSKKKPELMLPVGEVESFYAAVEGGADSVYLGLKKFNARARARNFNMEQLQAILQEARKYSIKTYVTLNTVIKNTELPELLDILYQLSQTTVDAVILQDWGVFFLIQQNFPQLITHASTQMANHNSTGARFSGKLGFERIIFARELTSREISAIRNISDIEMEIFVHGALCYSFSGLCLFSSYLGGMGANRGTCAQPCRRIYTTGESQKYLFSLKDNQLIDYIPKILTMGIDALKIEGRMKNAEYVYHVAKAYRLAIDSPEKITEAKKMLKDDLGRGKTAYFFGEDIMETMTENPNTGILIGTVGKVTPVGFSFQSSHPLQLGNRLRIHSSQGEVRQSIKIKDFTVDNSGWLNILMEKARVSVGDKIFLADLRQKKFQAKLETGSIKPLNPVPKNQSIRILSGMQTKDTPDQERVFLRVNTLQWLRKIQFNQIDGLFLNLTKKEWHDLPVDAVFLRKNRGKVFIELPKFIAEKDLDFYTAAIQKLYDSGYRRYMLSHLSQKDLLPKGSFFFTNENVYAYNDAAIAFLRSQGIQYHMYPYENDLDNLLKGKDRTGIVPLYFYPELFHSRMPVKLSEDSLSIKDDQGFSFRRLLRDGITIIIPERPVSLLQFKDILYRAGFRRFFIDLSHENVSKNIFRRLLNRYNTSTQVQPSTTFNFKRELK